MQAICVVVLPSAPPLSLIWLELPTEKCIEGKKVFFIFSFPLVCGHKQNLLRAMFPHCLKIRRESLILLNFEWDIFGSFQRCIAMDSIFRYRTQLQQQMETGETNFEKEICQLWLWKDVFVEEGGAASTFCSYLDLSLHSMRIKTQWLENYDFLSRSEDLRNQTFTLGRAKREKNEFAIFSSLMRIMRFAKNYKILHNWLDSA